MTSILSVQPIDLRLSRDVAALRDLMAVYAADPMGGGSPLPAAVLAHLPTALAARTDYCGWLAWHAERAVGLLNAFEGFSTFAAQALLNVHDLVVHPDYRGHGVGRALLNACETAARGRGCCKLTLEVLSGNRSAAALYRACGYAPYALDPAMGEAVLLQKWLAPNDQGQ